MRVKILSVSDVLLAQWLEQNKNAPTKYCIAIQPNCLNKAMTGARVQRIDMPDNHTYLLPVCKEHAVNDMILTVSPLYLSRESN